MSAASPTKVWPKQSKSVPDLTLRPPFTIDTILGVLGKTIFSPIGVALLPALTYHYDRTQGRRLFALAQQGRYPSFLSLKTLSHLLLREYPAIGIPFAIALIRLLSNALSRYVDNLGEWKPDRPNWSKEVVVITGGARGIGAKVVDILSHERRAKIAVLDLGEPEYAVAPQGAPPIHYYKVDVSNAEQVAQAAESIRSSLGPPTMLINNAGIFNGTLLIDADASSAEKAWRVNTLAHFVTVKEFLPHMIKSNHGHVLSLASAASYTSLPQMGQYTTSKSAALAFHEVLQGELRTRYKAPRVRTSIFCPTKVRTMMGDTMEDHQMAFVHPNLMPIEVAWEMVRALDSGLSQFVVKPKIMTVAAPLWRAIPSWVRRSAEVLTHTDHIVNDTSVKRAHDHGYGR